MVVNCSSFINEVSCSLTLTNEYNIKLLTLTVLLIYSSLVYYFHENIDPDKSYMHFWGFYLAKVLSIGYLMFTPLFFLLLLNHSISLEIFITIIVSFYLMMVGLFIGMSIYGGTSIMFKMFGFNDWNEFKDNRADKASKIKYG